MNTPLVDDEGMFDGALLFDPRMHLSPDGVVGFNHCGTRLGLVRDKGGYFSAEFLKKEQLSWDTNLWWVESRSHAICGSSTEALVLVKEWTTECPEEYSEED
jgi:hypothetical protein